MIPKEPKAGVFKHPHRPTYNRPRASGLDKLAQLASNPTKAPQSGPKPLFSQSFEARAKPKHKSAYIGLNLALANSHSPMVKRYWRQYRCSSEIELDQATGKTKTAYCNTRTCQVCGRIRTAKMINQYGPIIEQTPNLYFLTVTAPTITGEFLRAEIIARKERIARGIKSLKQYNRRMKLDDVKAIVKLELTYNEQDKKHHPHLHILIQGEENAKYLLCHWMNNTPNAKIDGQNIKPADSGSCIEMFKYISKTTKKDEATGKEIIYPYHIIDEQVQALDRLRTFAVCGFPKQDPENDKCDPEEILDDVKPKGGTPLHFTYDLGTWNWYERSTGEALTNYKPDKVKELLILPWKPPNR
jgi:plasmid rolling circle replication initiator protein Rep